MRKEELKANQKRIFKKENIEKIKEKMPFEVKKKIERLPDDIREEEFDGKLRSFIEVYLNKRGAEITEKDLTSKSPEEMYEFIEKTWEETRPEDVPDSGQEKYKELEPEEFFKEVEGKEDD
ncbi:MAG: hypothetical protein GF370_03375 [Candidatus Nealsonbacteria bacterium]|nr:hypothetical protein [Candidatus Nealsonbacteria bacterium]